MNNIIGVVVSFVYFFGLLFLAPLFKKDIEVSRKFVHIMLGNWWFIVLFFFDNVLYASIVPFSFIFINYFSVKNNKKGGLLSELERKDSNKSHGIVLYPVAMLILVILSIGVLNECFIGGLGLLSLAYGDGCAALIGKKFNYKPFTILGNRKTVSGCFGMFFATFISLLLYLLILNIPFEIKYSLAISATLAIVATFFEAVTPAGFDNITVPLSVIGLFLLITPY